MISDAFYLQPFVKFDKSNNEICWIYWIWLKMYITQHISHNIKAQFFRGISWSLSSSSGNTSSSTTSRTSWYESSVHVMQVWASELVLEPVLNSSIMLWSLIPIIFFQEFRWNLKKVKQDCWSPSDKTSLFRLAFDCREDMFSDFCCFRRNLTKEDLQSELC